MKFMNTKGYLLGIFLLITGQFLAAQESKLTTLSSDGTETIYALPDVHKIVFENNTMTVNLKSGSDVTDILCVRFLTSETTWVENLKSESSVFVFPNPVKTHLTVTGVSENVRINLFNLNGILLQSILTEKNPTNIDVSSLQQGLYLLQVGEQIIKFVKQ